MLLVVGEWVGDIHKNLDECLQRNLECARTCICKRMDLFDQQSPEQRDRSIIAYAVAVQAIPDPIEPNVTNQTGWDRQGRDLLPSLENSWQHGAANNTSRLNLGKTTLNAGQIKPSFRQ